MVLYKLKYIRRIYALLGFDRAIGTLERGYLTWLNFNAVTTKVSGEETTQLTG